MTVIVAKSIAYDEDFYGWTQQQAGLLHERSDPGIDWAHVAEEIESLGKSVRRELRSRLRVLLQHYLKWQIQVAHRSGSWEATIVEQRLQIGELLTDSPSLRRDIPHLCKEAYRGAVLKAVADTGLPETSFPSELPFEVAQILSSGWLPGGQGDA